MTKTAYIPGTDIKYDEASRPDLLGNPFRTDLHLDGVLVGAVDHDQGKLFRFDTGWISSPDLKDLDFQQHLEETPMTTQETTDALSSTLAQRGSRYGSFTDHSRVTQAIKSAFAEGRNWGDLRDDMKECLEMVAHKIGRILNGDPEYKDSWHDILGYVKLVEDTLED